MLQRLLTLAAVVECLAGVAFALVPGGMVLLLLGLEPGVAAIAIARVAGVALIALGIPCWGARQNAGGAARSATTAITFYNAVVGLLLTGFAVTGLAHGIFIWIAAIFHLILGLAFAAALLLGDPHAKTGPS
jgi:hypothetical protein